LKFLTCQQSIVASKDQTKFAAISILHDELHSPIPEHEYGYTAGDVVLAIHHHVGEVLDGGNRLGLLGDPN